MKKIISTAIFALALAFSVSVVAEGYMFNMNLKVGMRNADVRALQEYLADAGFFSANPTGYFGSVTKRAVVAFQLANDLPGTGFVGPLTREVLNATVVVTPNPGTGTTCPAGFVCTPNNPTPGTGLVGSEGFAEVRISPVVTNNPNVTTNVDVPVYAVEFKAKQSDIMVERMNLEVAVTQSGSAENPATLINTIFVKDGSTVLATIPVNSTTFSKDTSVTPNKYYVQIAGLGVKVDKDMIKTLTVSFSTNSIDSDRVVTVNVYGTSGIRTVDGRGISSYNALADVRTHTFKKPGTSTATAKDDATTIYATNYRVNTTGNGAEKALTSTFAVKSETGASKITSVTVAVNTGLLSALGVPGTGGTLPSNLYIYDGSLLIDGRSVTASTSASGSVTFDLNNYNVSVAVDQTKTFTIKADMPSNTTSGTIVSTRVMQVVYEKPNGSSATIGTALPATAVSHFFAPVVPQFGKVSATLDPLYNGASGAFSGYEAKMILTVDPQGGNVDANATATVSLINVNTGAVVHATTTSFSFDGGITTIADGSVKNGTLTVGFPDALLAVGTTYKVRVTGIKWTPTGGSNQVQLAGFEALETNTRSR